MFYDIIIKKLIILKVLSLHWERLNPVIYVGKRSVCSVINADEI